MARYTGPKWKLSRRENFSIYDSEDWKVRPTTPGQHGKTPRNMRTAYATQFREKQKIKRIYGLLERQFRRFFDDASKTEGNTGLRFLQLLEMRLDNVVYRMGLAKTRPQARQLVSHGNVMVNGKKMDIPSYVLKPGDEVKVKENITATDWYKALREINKNTPLPKWVEELKDGGKVKSEPTRDMIDRAINEQLVIEFYSR
ncbi:MAG: 30S ribosomal protein S4 [bacterium]